MLPDENAVSFNLQTTGALKQRKRAIELLEARELFKSVEWLVEAEQPSLSAQGFGNKGGEERCRGQNFVQQATAFRREFRRKVHNFRKCAGLLVAQITSLTEGYLLLSEDPVQGGKMEWSQEEEGKGRTVRKERPRTTWCRTLARRGCEKRGIRKRGEGPRTCGMSVQRKRRFTRNAATATHAVAETKPNQRLMYYTYWGNLRQVSAVELCIPRVVEAHPRKVEDRVAEHVRRFPTTRQDTERRARAYRPQYAGLRRVAPGNRGRPNGPRARPHESRPLALSRHGPGRRTLLAVCPPSPPRPPSPRQASPPTSAEGCASPLALPLHDWSLHSDERSHVIGPPPH
ncbi:hypothetical protein ALC57_14001 [Trachymyrmex cornetzi]|uniref:Uncharacterized protein n=1 Tax=Trachymyrmex cornetzi TaxID=471704 RepID=A0A195DM68_9HYME|nr:hypothetical protein ALC57_14001 [Trachymyrmex cornetzi]